MRLIGADAEQSHDINPQERAVDRRSHAIAAEIEAAAFFHKIQNIVQLSDIFSFGQGILWQKSFQGMQSSGGLHEGSLAGMQDGKPQVVLPFHAGHYTPSRGISLVCSNFFLRAPGACEIRTKSMGELAWRPTWKMGEARAGELRRVDRIGGEPK